MMARKFIKTVSRTLASKCGFTSSEHDCSQTSPIKDEFTEQARPNAVSTEELQIKTHEDPERRANISVNRLVKNAIKKVAGRRVTTVVSAPSTTQLPSTLKSRFLSEHRDVGARMRVNSALCPVQSQHELHRPRKQQAIEFDCGSPYPSLPPITPNLRHSLRPDPDEQSASRLRRVKTGAWWLASPKLRQSLTDWQSGVFGTVNDVLAQMVINEAVRLAFLVLELEIREIATSTSIAWKLEKETSIRTRWADKSVPCYPVQLFGTAHDGISDMVEFLVVADKGAIGEIEKDEFVNDTSLEHYSVPSYLENGDDASGVKNGETETTTPCYNEPYSTVCASTHRSEDSKPISNTENHEQYDYRFEHSDDSKDIAVHRKENLREVDDETLQARIIELEARLSRAKQLAGDNGRRSIKHKARADFLQRDVINERSRILQLESECNTKDCLIQGMQHALNTEVFKTREARESCRMIQSELNEAMAIADGQQEKLREQEKFQQHLKDKNADLLEENERVQREHNYAQELLQNSRDEFDALKHQMSQAVVKAADLKLHIRALNNKRAVEYIECGASEYRTFNHLRPDQLADAEQALMTSQNQVQKMGQRVHGLVEELESKDEALVESQARVQGLQAELHALRACLALTTTLKIANETMIHLLASDDDAMDNQELANAAKTATEAEHQLSSMLCDSALQTVSLRAKIEALERRHAKEQQDKDMRIAELMRTNIELDAQTFVLEGKNTSLTLELENTTSMADRLKEKAELWRQQIEERAFAPDLEIVLETKNGLIERAENVNKANFQLINHQHMKIEQLEMDYSNLWLQMDRQNLPVRKVRHERDRYHAIVRAFHQRFADYLVADPLEVDLDDFTANMEEDEINEFMKIEDEWANIIKTGSTKSQSFLSNQWPDAAMYEQMFDAVKVEEEKRKLAELEPVVVGAILDDVSTIPGDVLGAKEEQQKHMSTPGAESRLQNILMIPAIEATTGMPGGEFVPDSQGNLIWTYAGRATAHPSCRSFLRLPGLVSQDLAVKGRFVDISSTSSWETMGSDESVVEAGKSTGASLHLQLSFEIF